MGTFVERSMDAFEFQSVLHLNDWLFLVLACLLDGYVYVYLAVGTWMSCICYFDVFGLVNMLGAWVVSCIAFGRN